jgi:hypothetical protein
MLQYSIFTNWSDHRLGFGLEIGFIDRFTTRLETTSNYSAIAKVHTLQITTAHAKSFPACCVFTSRFLATASKRGDSSASALTSLLPGSQLWTNCCNCQLSSDSLTESYLTSRHGPCRKHRSFLYSIVSPGMCLFAKALPSNGCVSHFIKNLLPHQRVYSLQYYESLFHGLICLGSKYTSHFPESNPVSLLNDWWYGHVYSLSHCPSDESVEQFVNFIQSELTRFLSLDHAATSKCSYSIYMYIILKRFIADIQMEKRKVKQ